MLQEHSFKAGIVVSTAGTVKTPRARRPRPPRLPCSSFFSQPLCHISPREVSWSAMRCFLAIELPAAVRNRLAELQRRLSSLDRLVRWTQVDHIHLTVKFLGEVPDADVSKVCEAATRVAQDYPPFELQVRGTGCFPPRGPARIVWAGLANLPAQSVRAGLRRVGFRTRESPFPPPPDHRPSPRSARLAPHPPRCGCRVAVRRRPVHRGRTGHVSVDTRSQRTDVHRSGPLPSEKGVRMILSIIHPDTFFRPFSD
jgi:hypothetical protein